MRCFTERTHNAPYGNSDSWAAIASIATFGGRAFAHDRARESEGKGSGRRLCVRIARAPQDGPGEEGFAFANPIFARGET